jgi:hypothetical protein
VKVIETAGFRRRGSRSTPMPDGRELVLLDGDVELAPGFRYACASGTRTAGLATAVVVTSSQAGIQRAAPAGSRPAG